MSPFAASPGEMIALAVAFVGFAVASVVLAVIDLREHRLPNRVVLPAYPVALVLLVIACLFGQTWGSLLRAVVGGVVMFVFYLLLRAITRRGVGGGDVKLAGLAGIFLGWVGWGALVVGLVSAFLIGGAIAVFLVAVRRAGRSTPLAFGPSLLAGAWVGILAGEQFARAYLGI